MAVVIGVDMTMFMVMMMVMVVRMFSVVLSTPSFGRPERLAID
jgi:hypothetical protein